MNILTPHPGQLLPFDDNNVRRGITLAQARERCERRLRELIRARVEKPADPTPARLLLRYQRRLSNIEALERKYAALSL